MMSTKKYSPERLMLIRRLRKARRYYKQLPLFAYSLMVDEHAGYTYAEFLEDLRPRKPSKKKQGKSRLNRYGRYERMQKLLMLYDRTQELSQAIQAKKLRERLTQPYRVQVRVGTTFLEYSLSPLIPIERIEKLVEQLANVQSEKQADTIVEEFANGIR